MPISAAILWCMSSDSSARRVAHLDSTMRALAASRDLIVALRMCDKAMHRVRNEVNDQAASLASRMSEHLYCVNQLAKQLRQEIEQCAEERMRFWNRR